MGCSRSLRLTRHRGVDAPWLAGLTVVLVAFAVTWVAQPIGDRSESGAVVELVIGVVLLAGPVIVVVATLLGLTRLGRWRAVRWTGVAIALLVLLPVGLITAFWNVDLMCETAGGGCTTTTGGRVAGGTGAVAVWMAGWWLCRLCYTWRASRVSTGELMHRDSTRRAP